MSICIECGYTLKPKFFADKWVSLMHCSGCNTIYPLICVKCDRVSVDLCWCIDGVCTVCLNHDDLGNDPCSQDGYDDGCLKIKTSLRGGRRSGSGRKPNPDTVKRRAFSVSIPDPLCLKIQNFCESHGCSVNQYIIDSIKMRLNK